jgi:O-antigen ligase
VSVTHPLARPTTWGRTPLTERPLPWLLLSALAAVGVGILAHENSTALVDITAGLIAIYLFLKWPYLMLIVVLATGWKDNRAFELFTLVGGGVTVAWMARRAWRSTAAVCMALLLVLALPRLPIHPTYRDGFVVPHHFLPFTGIPFTGAISNELVTWWQLAFVLVAFLLGSWLIRDRRRLWQAVAISLATAAIPIAVGLQQYATGNLVVRPGTTQKSIEGPFQHPNYFGFYLLVIVVIALVAFLETQSNRIRAVLAVFLAAGIFCLFLTYTRSAWIGFVAAVLLLGLFRHRWIITFGTVVLVAAAFAFPGAVHAISTRFADLSSNSPTDTNSYAWRKGEWSRMIPYGLHHPLTGTGFGTYEADTVQVFGLVSSSYNTLQDPTHPAESPKGFSAHNDYVRMLVELGFPGVILWVLELVSLLAMTVRAAQVVALRSLAVGVGAVIVALTVASYSDNVQGYTIDLLYPFVLAGGLATVARSLRVAGLTGAEKASDLSPAASGE